MKTVLSVFFFSALMFLYGCEQDNEWTRLFNGENLDGWEIKGAEESNFFVEDGMLVAETKMGLPNTFLTTVRDYSDFKLEA
jgi:hypothetical protein